MMRRKHSNMHARPVVASVILQSHTIGDAEDSLLLSHKQPQIKEIKL